jgi:hypothetical protein
MNFGCLLHRVNEPQAFTLDFGRQLYESRLSKYQTYNEQQAERTRRKSAERVLLVQFLLVEDVAHCFNGYVYGQSA